MGLFLGKILVETPKHEVIKKGIKYEIREYEPCIAAEVSYDASAIRGGRDGGFMILASYIGAFGSPANKKASTSVTDSNVTDPNDGRREGEKSEEKGQKIAMTAPVVTKSSESEAIAMTAPVITMEIGSQDEKEDEEKKKKKVLTTMQFILPSKYTMETVPKPTDERVKLREIPKRTVAAITFSGVANESLTQKKLVILRKALQEEESGYRTIGEHVLARYNDPFTPWFLRTNEVIVPVEKADLSTQPET
ncbi:unnamed protein product [Calypogeia fissa]